MGSPLSKVFPVGFQVWYQLRPQGRGGDMAINHKSLKGFKDTVPQVANVRPCSLSRAQGIRDEQHCIVLVLFLSPASIPIGGVVEERIFP